MEISRVKQSLLCMVEYEGHIYTFQECILWAAQDADGGRQLRYSAILQDKAGKSVLRVPLEAVKNVAQKGEKYGIYS